MHLSPSTEQGLKTQAAGHLYILNSVLLQSATPPEWKKNQEGNRWSQKLLY